MTINQDYLTTVNYTDKSRTKSCISYLVIHYIGAASTALNNVKYFQSTYRGASAHYFVGHDGEIYQCVLDQDVAWHCGASSYKHKTCRNSNSIGIELCVKKDSSGNWYYTDKTLNAAITLVKKLMDKYEIPVENIIRHYDVTGKICGEPHVRLQASWITFRNALNPYDKPTAAVKATSAKATIKWLQTELNIVADAGLTVDGILGQASKTATKSYQDSLGWTGTGIAGTGTISALAKGKTA